MSGNILARQIMQYLLRCAATNNMPLCIHINLNSNQNYGLEFFKPKTKKEPGFANSKLFIYGELAALCDVFVCCRVMFIRQQTKDLENMRTGYVFQTNAHNTDT